MITFFLDLPVEHDPPSAYIDVEVSVYEDLDVGHHWGDTGPRSKRNYGSVLTKVVLQTIGPVEQGEQRRRRLCRSHHILTER